MLGVLGAEIMRLVSRDALPLHPPQMPLNMSL